METNANDNWFSINPLELNPDYDPFCFEEPEGGEYDDILLLSAEKLKKLQEKRREEQRRRKEIPALLWLAKEMAEKREKLVGALAEVRDGTPYETYFKKKRSGGKRIIQAPSKQLKAVQRKINSNILKFQLQTPNVFGFSGGNIDCAIKPHLQAKSIFMVDIKDAFPSVREREVFDFFTEGRKAYYADWRGKWFSSKPTGYSKLVEFKPGYMSWYAARIITQLVIYQGRLPQGAPTSPRLFDLLFKRVDVKLTDFACNAGAVYTRYADNIFFSMDDEEFPGKVKNGILKKIRRCRFMPHKMKTEQLGSKPVRMLGLNVIDQEACNTRDFKRRLRKAIHHVGWMMDHGMRDTAEFETGWSKLQGQMAFARLDTLPKKLIIGCEDLRVRLAWLSIFK